jgi:UDP-glucose 4-epimerase
VPTVGLRFFNVYGPRQHPCSPYSGVISKFCNRLLRGEAIDVFGDGRQTRDFVFVDDVVRALCAAMNARMERPAVFNVCSGTQTSILGLARSIGQLCGCEPEIRFQPARPGEVVHSWGDPGAARRALALPDPVALHRGLEATLTWMNAAPKADTRMQGYPLPTVAVSSR